MAKLVDKTYGQALFELSVEADSVDEYSRQAGVILTLLDENPDLMALLGHPQISKEKRIEVVLNCFKDRVSDDLTSFLVIIVQAGRQKFIREILMYFLNTVKAYKHIGVAYVTSAVELSDEQKAAVRERLLAITDNVAYEMHFNVDASLLGGMVIRIGDKVVDSSIRTKLDTLSKNLMKIQI